MATKKADTISTLASFSDVVHRMSEERRQREDEFFEALKEQQPVRLASVDQITNDQLIEAVTTWQGSSDPRVTGLDEEYREACKKELKSRLGFFFDPGKLMNYLNKIASEKDPQRDVYSSKAKHDVFEDGEQNGFWNGRQQMAWELFKFLETGDF